MNAEASVSHRGVTLPRLCAVTHEPRGSTGIIFAHCLYTKADKSISPESRYVTTEFLPIIFASLRGI